MSKSDILLGFEVGSGEPVYLPLHHLAIFGITQLSGKTTTLEALISRSGMRAIAFITKRGEGGFRKSHSVTPYYKPRSDWQFVEGLVNVALGEKVKYEPGMRYAIMQVCKGRKDLEEIQQAAKDIAERTKREFMRSVYEKLVAYLDIVIPELKKWVFTDRLELREGVNVMNLSGMLPETQHLVVASTIGRVLEALDHVIVIVPEAWEELPQDRMTPVKWVAEQYIRKGAAIGDWLWLDSQDIGGIAKVPLRQCDNWIMGRMQEGHEIERILKQMRGVKVTAEEIKTLPLGHFYAAIGNSVRKVYVLPAGVPEDVGAKVARGELSPDYVKENFLKDEGTKVIEPKLAPKEPEKPAQKTTTPITIIAPSPPPPQLPTALPPPLPSKMPESLPPPKLEVPQETVRVNQALPNIEVHQYKPTLTVPVEMLNEPTSALGRVVVVLKNDAQGGGRQDKWTPNRIKSHIKDHAWGDDGVDEAISQLVRWEVLRRQSNNYLRFYPQRVEIVQNNTIRQVT